MKKFIAKLLVSATLVSNLYYSTSAATFQDVKTDDWHYNYITEMSDAGLLTGLGDGTFGPDSPLSMAQFTAMISNAFYGDTLGPVANLSTTFWWEPYLVTCFTRSAFAGTTIETEYGGEQVTQAQWDLFLAQAITRYDVAAMVHNVLLDRGVPELSVQELTAIVSDFNETIPPQYAVAVATAFHYGFLEGRGKTFDGEAGLTRAEAAVVLSGLVKSDLVETELLEDYVPEEEPEVTPEVEKTPDTDSEAETDTDSDTEADSEAESENDTDSVPDSKPEEVVPETEPEAEPEEEPKIEPVVPVSPIPEQLTTPETSLSQAELGSWIDYTIRGASAPNSYVYNSDEDIYVKNSSGLTITASDLTAVTDLQLEVGMEAPQIYIYHTHGTEAYTRTPYSYYSGSSWRSEDPERNVVAVGAVMAETFRQAGFNVIHNTFQYDAGGYYNTSYDRSRAGLVEYLEANPSIALVIDLHRDGLTSSSGTPYALVCDVGGETIAQVMLFIGTDASSNTPTEWRKNFALALSLQRGLQKYPDFARPVSLASNKYNQSEHTGAILIEVGGHGNTLIQGMKSAQLFAYSASQTLTGKSAMELFGYTLYE